MKLIHIILSSTSCYSPRKVTHNLFYSIRNLFSPGENLDSNCDHCRVRTAMQQKYLAEAHELYDEFFHIIRLPLLTEEVRGPEKLKEFSKMLTDPFVPETER